MSISGDPSVRCPNCGVALPTAGISPGATVECAQCGKQFTMPFAGMGPVTSGKAVTSLVLGMIPCLCITGVPAIFLGVWALADIRRRPNEVSGSGLAVFGILLGCVCS